MLIAHFDQDLGIIQLLPLRVDGEPESRTSTANECSQRFQNVLLAMFFSESFALLANHGFCPLGDHICRTERRIGGKLDVNI